MFLQREKRQKTEYVLKKVFDVLQCEKGTKGNPILYLFSPKKELTKQEIKLTLNEKTPKLES